MLLTYAYAVLVSCCDYPVVPITHVDNSYRHTSRCFNFEAMVPNDNSDPGNYDAELKKDAMSSHFSLFCMEASCNLTPLVMLELNHIETGDPERPDVEGSLLISADSENYLYGTYYGSGKRTENLYEFSCWITTGLAEGIFYTEKTQLNLSIKGISELEKPELIACEVVIDGYLRKP